MVGRAELLVALVYGLVKCQSMFFAIKTETQCSSLVCSDNRAETDAGVSEY